MQTSMEAILFKRIITNYVLVMSSSRKYSPHPHPPQRGFSQRPPAPPPKALAVSKCQFSFILSFKCFCLVPPPLPHSPDFPIPSMVQKGRGSTQFYSVTSTGLLVNPSKSDSCNHTFQPECLFPSVWPFHDQSQPALDQACVPLGGGLGQL